MSWDIFCSPSSHFISLTQAESASGQDVVNLCSDWVPEVWTFFFFHRGKRLVLAFVKVSMVHLSNNLESRKSRQILHPQICMKPVVSVHSTRVRLVKKL